MHNNFLSLIITKITSNHLPLLYSSNQGLVPFLNVEERRVLQATDIKDVSYVATCKYGLYGGQTRGVTLYHQGACNNTTSHSIYGHITPFSSSLWRHVAVVRGSQRDNVRQDFVRVRFLVWDLFIWWKTENYVPKEVRAGSEKNLTWRPRRVTQVNTCGFDPGRDTTAWHWACSVVLRGYYYQHVLWCCVTTITSMFCGAAWLLLPACSVVLRDYYHHQHVLWCCVTIITSMFCGNRGHAA